MDNLVNIVNHALSVLLRRITDIFDYIFPEYPTVGITIIAAALFMFLVLLFISGVGRASKLTGAAIAFAVFILLCVHGLMRLMDFKL